MSIQLVSRIWRSVGLGWQNPSSEAVQNALAKSLREGNGKGKSRHARKLSRETKYMSEHFGRLQRSLSDGGGEKISSLMMYQLYNNYPPYPFFSPHIFRTMSVLPLLRTNGRHWNSSALTISLRS